MSMSKQKLRAGGVAAALVACSLAPAFAGTDPPAQGSVPGGVGALTGLAVGAAVGGPVGAVIGVTAGVIIGDHYHRQRQSAAATSADLHKSEAERAQLAGNVTQLDASLAAARAEQTKLGATLEQTDQIGIDVGFRTDEDTIPAQMLPPLQHLGALAAAMPDTVVRIAGYADPRGAEEYNQALSLRRAQGVAALLTSAGVPAGQMIIEAHGSTGTHSAPGDLDGYALERRVTVRLEQPGVGEVASRD